MMPDTKPSITTLPQQSTGQQNEQNDSAPQQKSGNDFPGVQAEDSIRTIKSSAQQSNKLLTKEEAESSTTVIEVKRPPTPAESWKDGSVISEPVVGDNKKTFEAENVSEPAIDNHSNTAGSSKIRRPVSRDSSGTYSTKGIKSSIPRFARNHLTEKGSEKLERKPYLGVSRIPTSSGPLHTAGIHGTRRSTPTRSYASSISSRAASPAVSSHLSSNISTTQSRAQSNAGGSGFGRQQHKEINHLLEEMYSTLHKISDDELTEMKPDKPTESPGIRRVERKTVAPTKDGAGETCSPRRVGTPDRVKNDEWDIGLNIKRGDLFRCLSDLNGVNQANLKDLQSIIKHDSPRSNSKQAELLFYKFEQSQLELFQKLTKSLTQFYDDREKLQEEVKKLNVNQNVIIPNVEEKVALLDAENTSLTEKIKRLTQSLDEERSISQKRKITSQAVIQAKQRVQKVEGKQSQIDKKLNDLSHLAKKIEACLKQKDLLVEESAKKLKANATTIAELEEANANLSEELEELRHQQETKFSDAVNNSQELKDAKSEVLTLQQHLNDEVGRREKTATKLQDTTTRLKAMEDKCRNLSSLVDSAKNEVKMKDIESGEKEKKYVEEISQLHTELQARKVMLKVAEDEVIQIKNKLDRIEIQAKHEHQKERDATDSEEQLKMELAIRDEQITQLQEQIKSLIEKKFNVKESQQKLKTKNKLVDKQSGNSFNERVALTAQVVDLERTIDALAKDNLQLNQILNQKNLELDQRDRILKMQTEVLKIRDELIWLLKSKEQRHEEDIKRLNDVIQERENAIAKEWDKALKESKKAGIVKSSQEKMDMNPDVGTKNEESLYLSGTMYELYSTLERKQLELESMQHKVQQLEGLQDAYNKQRTRHEARISRLEMALSEKCLDNSGLVSILAN